MKKLINLNYLLIYFFIGNISIHAQKATWIHPDNATIEETKITKETQPGCGINALCLGDILSIPFYEDIKSLDFYYKEELIQQVRPTKGQKYIKIPITADISKKMAKNYSIKINSNKK